MEDAPETTVVHVRGINRDLWRRLRLLALRRDVTLVALLDTALGEWLALQEQQEKED